MSANVICGRCGSLLPDPSSACAHCGSAARFPGYVRPAKSPWLAALLAALIPGMGHIYLGHYKKGFLYLLGTGGLEFIGLDLDLTAVGAAVGIPMELGGLGLWAHGVFDAYRTARNMR